MIIVYSYYNHAMKKCTFDTLFSSSYGCPDLNVPADEPIYYFEYS